MLCQHIPSVQTRFLRGEDVELWTEQSVWDAVLKNIRIVVSTPKVLLDGLTHAFVRLESIALLVVDEGDNTPQVAVRTDAEIMKPITVREDIQRI